MGTAMSKTLVRNAGWVVTMDPERRIIADGAVAIEDDRIVAVGKSAEGGKSFRPDREIDAREKLVLPRLRDTACHKTHQLGRRLADCFGIPMDLLEPLSRDHHE